MTMASYCLALALFLIFATSCMATPFKTQKLAVYNMEGMAQCALGHNVFELADYGCWCGPGGSGTPIDGVDNCCMHHDKCYDAAVDDGDCRNVMEEYLDPDDWSCSNHTIVCKETTDKCKAALCNCDRNVVMCWSKFPKVTSHKGCTKSKRIW
ncbi:hypothetical protein L596_028927 [Steinernema carpocapsae]|uniref:Phospholipase A2 n=1 Tax=Steinernema carpocapsae TaxID=34508 RepID=A0A4U5LZT3_STECR|nr:hypothetical protein L596_028927 [Steinernema carpocapsae]